MPIPQYIKASAGLTRSAQYAGEIDPASLERLSSELVQPGSTLSAELGLERDAKGSWLRGRVEGGLWLTCQRCLNDFEWPLDVDVELRLVQSEAEEARVLEEADPFLVEDDKLPLVEIVENEVLLALPMMPRCSECEAAAADEAEAPAKDAEAALETVQKKPNPFAQLLKK
ncbi:MULTISPECIES: YceD family protein [Hydrocarboniphaga]|uniref:Large ribosomal RNA subunit accumulation protein YceD n=1 Tax=Hydrocarboniphaga effusa AP103 TaxID=1172194 RepID=I8I1J6_9GAMM|nr:MULTISPECIES: DUF177 domain-containing protein [Hydrocarboniphaga]EIT69581.1 hypothetical protein WQQ_31630 [Hydrocarboniphaga effusa AP103]MDZ4080107.1 DUF177 domain-containing protein [Hydrocarboniphaga sp.]